MMASLFSLALVAVFENNVPIPDKLPEPLEERLKYQRASQRFQFFSNTKDPTDLLDPINQLPIQEYKDEVTVWEKWLENVDQSSVKEKVCESTGWQVLMGLYKPTISRDSLPCASRPFRNRSVAVPQPEMRRHPQAGFCG